MGKVKNLEKKIKPKADFDKNSPENRKKSLNNVKVKKNKAKDVADKKNKKVAMRKKMKILQQIKKEVGENKSKEETDLVETTDKLVKREIVDKAVIALKNAIKNEMENSKKKNLFDDELRLGLQVVSVKIPQTPPHVRKM